MCNSSVALSLFGFSVCLRYREEGNKVKRSKYFDDKPAGSQGKRHDEDDDVCMYVRRWSTWGIDNDGGGAGG